MGEDEVVALGGVGPERLVLLGGGAGLDVADGEPERVVDLLESGVRAGVPGRVGDAAGGDETDPDAGGPRGRSARKLATAIATA